METVGSTYIDSLLKQLEDALGGIPPEARPLAAQRLAGLAAVLGTDHRGTGENSEERFRSMLEYSLDVVYRRNLQLDCYDYMSSSSARVLTYTPEEMLAMSIEEVLGHVHPDDRQAIEDGIRVADLAGSARLEYRWRGRDGQYRWLADFVSVQRDAAGNPLYRGGILRDITGQKQAEEALRQSEARFRIALEGSPVTVFAHDRELRYQWVFNSFLRLPVEQILGRRDDEILPPQDIRELVAAKQAALDSGKPVHREVHLRMGGQDYWRILTAEPVQDETGAITGVRGAGIDITELRRLQMENQEHMISMDVKQRLMQYREQERQEIARELHDGPIQTLVSVLFQLQMLMDASQNPALEVEFDQAMHGLRTAVRGLRDTVNELRPPSLIHFGLTKVIQMHALDFQDQHPEIALRLDLFDDQNRVDDQTNLALFRIYQEGLKNAVLHSGATRVEVRYRVNAGQLVLELADNGQGFTMPEDLRELTRMGHFGLAGMAERAEAAGGKIHVRSAPGEGTVLVAVLPYRAK